MQVLIDGKEYEVRNDVKIIQGCLGDDEDIDLHFTFTEECVIADAIRDGQVISTYCNMWGDELEKAARCDSCGRPCRPASKDEHVSMCDRCDAAGRKHTPLGLE